MVQAGTIRQVQARCHEIKGLQDAQAGVREPPFHLKQNFLVGAIYREERIESVHAKTLMRVGLLFIVKGFSRVAAPRDV